MRHGQATVLLIALALPAVALALLGLACLAAGVQRERAQRLADGAALAAAIGRTPRVPRGTVLTLRRIGGATQAEVTLPMRHLQLPLVGPARFAAHAIATARPIDTDDGRPGAALVG